MKKFKNLLSKNNEYTELELNESVQTEPENKKAELKAAVTDDEKAAIKHAKKLKRRKRQLFWDRVAGFIIATVLVVGCSCLTLEYIIVKGPSPALRDMFINTMYETRRFRFIPQIFLTEDEVKALRDTGEKDTSITTDTSMINLNEQATETVDGTDAYGLVDEDGDGVIFKEVKGNGFSGYMLVILDPTRVFIGKPDLYGGVGLTLEELVNKYDALGGINAGGFKDDGGNGFGGLPEGLTVIEGECYNSDMGMYWPIAGLDDNGMLYVGYYDYNACVDLGITNAVSFSPILITNGVPTPEDQIPSSVNPRTAIGQRGDGAIVMMVIDGRQVHSIGATYQDMINILLDHGVVNAINMDGGSSTVMHYEGRYVNSCSAEGGQPRPLPNAFLFK